MPTPFTKPSADPLLLFYKHHSDLTEWCNCALPFIIYDRVHTYFMAFMPPIISVHGHLLSGKSRAKAFEKQFQLHTKHAFYIRTQ